ncbi:MAG: Leucine-tRNA ligase, partial [Candidatus Jorgensenbacteria bacterium GW2011_GWA2_45_13]
GALIKFKIQISKIKTEAQKSKLSDESIEVFTTRPDTLFGATYMVVAPEHEIISNLKNQISNFKEVEEYITKSKKKSEEERIENKEKTGAELKGIKAINPANKEEIPIFVADYVFASYGTGAIMAVPAHDERDFEFANKYNIPIRQVVVPENELRAIIVTQTLNDPELFKKELSENNINYNLATSSISKREHIQIEIQENELDLFIQLIQKYIEEQNWVEILGSQNVIVMRDGIYRNFLGESDKWFRQFQQWEPALKGQKNIWELLKKNDFLKGLICFKEDGILVNSGEFDGMDSETAKWEITKFVGGKKHIQYRLRDWLISRQRYWGPPIPIIYCRKCWEIRNSKSQIPNKSEAPNPKFEYGVHYTVIDGKEHMIYPVPEEELPVKLPMVKDFRPKGKDESPLASVKSFYETTCPGCGGPARRETDVSDTFLDSAWYYLRYPSVRAANAEETPWNSEITKRWLPARMYIGGAEHSVLHLLYVRFVALALRDMKLLDFPSKTGEPFPKFRAHGLVIKDGVKMSKSKGNIVNPDEYVKKFGADAFRMYLMFLAPFEQGGDFRDQGILGVERFLKRVYELREKIKPKAGEKAERKFHEAIKKVTEDIEGLHYNTAISALMILLNEFEACGEISEEQYKTFLKLIAPFAPFLTEEVWSRFFGEKKSRILDSQSESGQIPEGYRSIHKEEWPTYDAKKLIAKTFMFVVQVNGKVRDQFEVSADITQEEAETLALASEKVQRHLGGIIPKKKIYVAGRLLNLVV